MSHIIWDSHRQCVLSSPKDQPLLKAALHYFRQAGITTPETLGTPGALAVLEDTLTTSPDELMRQCALIIHTANAVLDEEGQQLATIFTQQGKPLICKRGCARCCHQLVLCRPFEAHSIKAFLEATPDALAAFAHTYADWDKATSPIRRSYLAWAEAFYGRGEDDGSHVVEDFQPRCPFLDAQDCCTIYPVRPYGCRTCIALDPACPSPPPGHDEHLYIQYSLYTSHHASRQAMTELLLRKLCPDTASVPMPEMVAALLPHI